MRNSETISISFLKGILLSFVLLFLQIYFSAASSEPQQESEIRMEVSSQLPHGPDESNSETFLKQSGGPHASGHVVVNREILYLFEIIFSEHLTLGDTDFRVPIPLVSFLRVLFSSSISVNAP
jgi:hypothetical protein